MFRVHRGLASHDVFSKADGTKWVRRPQSTSAKLLGEKTSGRTKAFRLVTFSSTHRALHQSVPSIREPVSYDYTRLLYFPLLLRLVLYLLTVSLDSYQR